MSRLNFASILAKYKANGKGNVRLTQSTLFLSKPIDPTKTTYNFDVLETQTSTLESDEIRLNLNDEFIITAIGMYLEARIIDPFNPLAIPINVKKLLTYAPSELNGVNGALLQNFYAGQMKIGVNNIIYLDKWDTRKHEYVPRTQFSNFRNVVGVNEATLPSNDFSKNAMYPIEPMLVLSGAKKNEVTVTLPTAITAGTFTYIDDLGIPISLIIDRVGVLFRGLNAQNAASFQR